MGRDSWSLVFALSVLNVACAVHGAEPGDKQLSIALRQALEAEAAGQIDRRQALLDDAARKEPSSDSVHWHLGHVKAGTDWIKIEQYAEQAKTKNALIQYRELRGKSQPTVESQLQVADFCRRHNLRDQERAHLSAILELDANHADARKRMGHKLVDGEWRTAAEIAEARKQAQQIAAATRKHKGTLNTLGQSLKEDKISSSEAMAQLQSTREVAIIPAWELHVSTPSSAGGLVVTDALKDMPDAEASLSLARHALYSPWHEVSSTAADLLRRRDEFSFIPALLGMLRSRWVKTVELLQGLDGRVVYRHTYFSDGQDKQQLAVFDQVFFLQGFLPDAFRQASLASMSASRAADQRRSRENAAIQEVNRRVGQLLVRVTGEEHIDSPDGWWQWWYDRNGIYFKGDKPLEQSYATSFTTVVASSTSGNREGRDCLAGGTPVWTESGPKAVDRIKMGDLVLAKDVETGELAFQPVLRTTVRAPDKLLQITTDAETIRTSGGHPFWVSGKGWVRAWNLEPGMVLHGAEVPSVVREIVVEEEPVRTFNLIVDGYHSYFAGESKLLTHDNSIRKPTSCLVPGLAE